MDCLIIYCHPYDKSFNHAIFENIKENKSYKVIDLYKDSFVPYYDLEEMRLFHTGQTHDPLVKRYLSWLKETSEVIFITPFWWNGIPGMLKGFIDKVMKEGEGLSHTVTKTGIHGELTNVKHTYVFTTSTSPTFYLKLFLGNGIKRIFINKTLKQLGMQDCHWYNFGGVSTSSVDRHKKYLEKILKINL